MTVVEIDKTRPPPLLPVNCQHENDELGTCIQTFCRQIWKRTAQIIPFFAINYRNYRLLNRASIVTGTRGLSTNVRFGEFRRICSGNTYLRSFSRRTPCLLSPFQQILEICEMLMGSTNVLQCIHLRTSSRGRQNRCTPSALFTRTYVRSTTRSTPSGSRPTHKSFLRFWTPTPWMRSWVIPKRPSTT